MPAGVHDRLSDLPDDLLRRILHFAPLKEAASTTALSRRWHARPHLWLSSGALNLETGVESYYPTSRRPQFFSRRDDFISAATRALDATDVAITRLTVRRHINEKALSGSDMVDVLLSHPAARRVEELRLVANRTSDHYGNGGLYMVTLHSLPLETLRVLELTNCQGILYERQHATAVVLPRLSSLRISHSDQHLRSLQRIIDMAPVLSAVRLECSLLIGVPEEDAKGAKTLRLRCLAANVLVLDSCHGCDYYHHQYTIKVDMINAPRLRRFRYKGSLHSFSFSPALLELEQVDLDFHDYKVDKTDPNRYLEIFWRFARNFTNTKETRLSVDHLEDIAVLVEAKRIELLPAFHRLERLEVHGKHWTKGKTAAVMTILNLLRCCPVLNSLRMNLTAKHEDDSNNKQGVRTRASQKEIQIAGMLGPRHFFQCLKSSLKRVGLQFRLEKSDCLGVKLIKFFAENAMVLEEMRIHGGDQKLCEHMNPKTKKWNKKRKKLGATCFVVLPLNSRFY